MTNFLRIVNRYVTSYGKSVESTRESGGRRSLLQSENRLLCSVIRQGSKRRQARWWIRYVSATLKVAGIPSRSEQDTSGVLLTKVVISG